MQWDLKLSVKCVFIAEFFSYTVFLHHLVEFSVIFGSLVTLSYITDEVHRYTELLVLGTRRPEKGKILFDHSDYCRNTYLGKLHYY